MLLAHGTSDFFNLKSFLQMTFRLNTFSLKSFLQMTFRLNTFSLKSLLQMTFAFEYLFER